MIIHFLRIFLIGIIGPMDKHITVFLTVIRRVKLKNESHLQQ